MLDKRQPWSRRNLLRLAATAGAASLVAPALAAERVRPRISDVRTMTVQGPGRTYVYVKIETKDGTFGVAEAYGTPGVGVAEQTIRSACGNSFSRASRTPGNGGTS